MPVDAAHLRDRVDNANTAVLSAMCQLLLLSTQQNDAAKKNRLKSFIKGPVGRHRIGWLDLAFECYDEGISADEECDHAAYGLLCDYRERLGTARVFKSCLPIAVLGDLDRVDNAGDTAFTLPGDFRWPTGLLLDDLESTDADGVGVFDDRVAAVEASSQSLQRQMQQMPAKVESNIKFRLRENQTSFGGAGSSTQDQRKASVSSGRCGVSRSRRECGFYVFYRS